MHPAPPLRLALDHTYKAFAEYPRPMILDASPLRDPARIKALLTEPLQALSVEILSSYSGWAMTTVGEVEDYKYFLPRILELAAASALVEPEMIANKLVHGHWQEWPPHESSAVASVFRAAFTQAVGEHTDDDLAEPWFLGAVRLGLNVDDLMRTWEAAPLPNAMLQLTGLMSPSGLFRDKLNGVWSEADSDVVRAVRFWLLSPDVGDRLIMAGLVASDRDIWMLDSALEMQAFLAGQFK